MLPYLRRLPCCSLRIFQLWRSRAAEGNRWRAAAGGHSENGGRRLLDLRPELPTIDVDVKSATAFPCRCAAGAASLGPGLVPDVKWVLPSAIVSTLA